MNSFNFNTTPGIIFGNGVSIKSRDKIISKLGNNIFLITDPGLTKIGLNRPIIDDLSKYSNLEVFDDVESDPSKETLIKAFDKAKAFKPTGILGFGGGSSMDIAKLVSMLFKFISIAEIQLLPNSTHFSSFFSSQICLKKLKITSSVLIELSIIF